MPLYYQNAGAAFTSGGEECIQIADVFSFLIKETSMKDSAEENAPLTDPDALAARLRGFGQQTTGDGANAGVYTWMGDKLKLFVDEDDDYVYQNMQRAYFLNDTPDMDTVYNDFASKFNTIKSDTFNLNNDENGLFYYDGNILNLKVSDRALAVIVREKQSFAAAVTGEGMTVELMSLKLYHEDAKLVIESGVKIGFDGRDSYKMMPDYFFVIAKTKSDGMGGFTTTVSMNNLTTDVTNTLFRNINSLSTKGMTSSFDKTNIETTINNAIATALGKFPNSVTFGEFTSSDVTNEYNTTTYGDTIRVAAGDGYISFPSVYSYLIDMFYTSDKPSESEMQHMLVSLHSADNNLAAGKSDAALRSAIVTNEKSDSAYHVTAFKGTNLSDAVGIASDRYLAHEINTRFSTVTINANFSLADTLQQIIVLRGLDGSEALGARADWEGKFSYAEGSGYSIADNCMIATAILDLSAYNSGDKTSILPEKLWFTVLADMTNTNDSEGLLYDMNAKDMEIFETIVNKYNTFNIKNISVQFAQKLDEKLSEYAGVATINYKRSDLADSNDWDDFVYYTDIFAASNPANALHTTIYNETYGKVDGVGYVVLADTAV